MSLQTMISYRLVADDSDSILSLIEKTYVESFPEIERRDFYLIRDLLKNNSYFRIYAFYKESQYVGFITSWFFDEFVYIEHFAIDSVFRNGGIGAEVLKQFISFSGSPIVLEVEVPIEEISRRRVNFYERMGFVLDNHNYYQPPYREGGDGLDLRLMRYGELDLNASYEQVKQVLYTNVYGITEIKKAE